MVAHYLELCKLRIGFVITLTAVVGYMAVADDVNSFHLIILAVAVLLGSSSSSVLNHFFDRDIDRLMKRTRNRPVASGTLTSSGSILLFATVLLVAGVGMLVASFNWIAGLHLFLGAFTYGIVYTVWLKRRTVWNIIFGGAAGSFAILAGAAAFDPTLVRLPLLMAFILFLWTPSHFWALAILLRDDYDRAGIPMLPCVVGEARCAGYILANSIMLVSAGLLPYVLGEMGPVYGILAALAGLHFLWLNYRLRQEPGKANARKVFFGSMVYLMGIFLAIVLDRHLFSDLLVNGVQTL